MAELCCVVKPEKRDFRLAVLKKNDAQFALRLGISLASPNDKTPFRFFEIELRDPENFPKRDHQFPAPVDLTRESFLITPSLHRLYCLAGKASSEAQADFHVVGEHKKPLKSRPSGVRNA